MVPDPRRSSSDPERRIAAMAVVVAGMLGGCAEEGKGAAEGPAPAPALVLEATIRLPGVEGRIDHLAYDADAKRLAVAALENGTVEVVDVAGGNVVKTIRGLEEPQGIAIEPGTGRIVVACGGDGSVRYYDPKTFELASRVETGGDADNLRFEEATYRLWVGFGSGGLAAIEKGEIVARVPLAQHPESFQLERRAARAYVNVPKADHVAVVDREKKTVAATWPMAEAHDAYPMALDEARRRLFIGCRRPARLLVLDTETGKTVGSLEISGDVDDIWLDDAKGVAYLSCGEGFFDVVRRGDDDVYERVARVATAAGARTSLFTPSDGRLYLAVPHRGAQVSEVRVYGTRP